jgi:hypothetical protein
VDPCRQGNTGHWRRRIARISRLRVSGRPSDRSFSRLRMRDHRPWTSPGSSESVEPATPGGAGLGVVNPKIHDAWRPVSGGPAAPPPRYRAIGGRSVRPSWPRETAFWCRASAARTAPAERPSAQPSGCMPSPASGQRPRLCGLRAQPVGIHRTAVPPDFPMQSTSARLPVGRGRNRWRRW